MTKLKNDTISLISLDIETTGLQSNSATVSIGAYHIASIKHNRERVDATSSEFYVICNVADQLENGAFKDPETIKWWKQQPRDVLSAFEQSISYDIEDSFMNPIIVDRFLAWCNDLPGSPVWVVQGADFDIPIINSFLQMYGSSLPGFHRHKICLRTLLMTNPVGKVKNDQYHNALADAKAQAKRFVQISPQSKELLVDYLFTSAGY
jgi:hypothetical protein